MSIVLILAFALCALAFILLVGWPLAAALSRILVSAVLFAALALPAAAASGELLTALTPSLLDLSGAVLTFVISAAALRFQRWTGIQIEARHREALHSALMTAARLAVSRGLTQEAGTSFVTSYVQASVPDALRGLAPSESTLVDLAKSKLAQLID